MKKKSSKPSFVEVIFNIVTLPGLILLILSQFGGGLPDPFENRTNRSNKLALFWKITLSVIIYLAVYLWIASL